MPDTFNPFAQFEAASAPAVPAVQTPDAFARFEGTAPALPADEQHVRMTADHLNNAIANSPLSQDSGDPEIKDYAGASAQRYGKALKNYFPNLPDDEVQRGQEKFQDNLTKHLQGSVLRQHIEAAKNNPQKFWNQIGEVLPGVKSGQGLLNSGLQYWAGENIRAGQGTPADYRIMGAAIGKGEEYAQKTGIGKLGEVAAPLPAEVAEWMAGAGPGKWLLQKLGLGAATSATAKVTATLLAGLARTAIRPDKAIGGMLEDMSAKIGIDENGNLTTEKGRGPSESLIRSLGREGISNVSFEAGGLFGPKTGLSVGGLSTGLAKGLTAAEGSKAIAYWTGAGGQADFITRMRQAKTPEEKQEAAADMLRQVVAFGGLELGTHVAGTIQQRMEAQGMSKAQSQIIQDQMDKLAAKAWEVAPKPPEAAKQTWNHTGTEFADHPEGVEFTAADGKKYTIRPKLGTGALTGKPYVQLFAHDPEGKEVGNVRFDRQEGNISASDVGVTQDLQGKDKTDLRRSIVNGLYDFMHEEATRSESEFPGQLVPSEGQSKGGKAIWERNAALKPQEAPKTEAPSPPEPEKAQEPTEQPIVAPTTTPEADVWTRHEGEHGTFERNERTGAERVVPTPTAAPEAPAKTPITSVDRKEILGRAERGEGNLTDQEKHVLNERLSFGVSHAELGRDLGVSHTQIQNLEASGLDKLGYEGTVDEHHKANQAGQRAVAKVENGAPPPIEELAISDPGGAVHTAREAEIADAEQQLQALHDDFAARQRQGRKLTPTEQEDFDGEFKRLTGIIDQSPLEEAEPAGQPPETPGARAGAAPVRPEPAPGVQPGAAAGEGEPAPPGAPGSAQGVAEAPAAAAPGGEAAGNKLRPAALRFADRMEARALENLRKKTSGLFTGIDPSIIPDLAQYVAAKIIKGGYSLANWLAEAAQRFGEAARPRAQEVWDRAQVFVQTANRIGETGIKNETVDQEREARGLPPAMQEAERSFGEVWDQAMEKEASDPGAADRLVQELKDKPRAVNDQEDALLLHRQVELSNDYEKAAKGLEFARAGGDATDIADAERSERDLRDKLQDLYDVNKKVGTETGRGLNARKMLAAEDFSLSRMMTQAAAAHGRPLTSEEQQEVQQHHEQIAAAQGRLDEAAAAFGQRPGALAPGFGVSDWDIAPAAESPRAAAIAAATSPEFRNVLEARTARDQARQGFQRSLDTAQKANQGFWRKAADFFTKLRVNMVISSPTTLAKIAAASLEKIAITPLEEAAGALWSRLPGISKIAAMAPREGRGLTPTAEARAFASAFTDGLKDSWQTLRSFGESQLDILHGKDQGVKKNWTDLQFALHAAFKAPAVRAEYTRSFLNRIDAAVKAGQDATGVDALLRMSAEAYKDSQRAKFQQENWLIDAYNKGVASLRAPGQPVAAQATGFAAKMLLPVVKISTNLAFEVGTHIFGLGTGTAQATRAYMRGIENLKPAEADSIMRQFKKGSLGGAVALMGLFMPGVFGGYYSGKRKEEDVPAGAMRIGGITIPSWAMHNPLLETAQFFATIRRTIDSIHKDEDAGVVSRIAEGLTGFGEAMRGVGEEIPFVREGTEIGRLMSPKPRERGWYFGEMAKSFTVPQFMQWMAGRLDPKEEGQIFGEARNVKPQTTLEHIEAGIPGLRQRIGPGAKTSPGTAKDKDEQKLRERGLLP